MNLLRLEGVRHAAAASTCTWMLPGCAFRGTGTDSVRRSQRNVDADVAREQGQRSAERPSERATASWECLTCTTRAPLNCFQGIDYPFDGVPVTDETLSRRHETAALHALSIVDPVMQQMCRRDRKAPNLPSL